MIKEKAGRIVLKLSNLFQRLLTFLEKIRYRRKKDKPIPDQKPSIEMKPVHPWRMCPGGEHWVHTHLRKVPVSEKNPSGITSVEGHCRPNPSGKDQLYIGEMHKISERHFGQFKLTPLPPLPEFQSRDFPYDHLIQGWTQYWNDVLNPNELLDPCIIKALIASESSFHPNSWNKIYGPKRARGLIQVTDETLRYLSSKKIS